MIRTATLCAAMLSLTVSTAATADPLSGSEWRPTDIAGVEPSNDAELSVSFGEDGKLTGRGGCNSFFATYGIDGDRIEIGPLGSTMMACAEPVMDVEAGFLKALTAARRFDATNLTLILRDDDDNTLARLARTDAD